MTSIRISTAVRAAGVRRFAALLAIAIAVAGCSNPRAPERTGNFGAPPASADRGGQAEAESVRLIAPHKVGQRYRTTRTLRVEEKTETDNLVITSEEVTLTQVLRVDESGRPLGVKRSWEAGSTTVVANGGTPDRKQGELDGCTLELTQRASGVDVRVLVGEVDVGRQQFVIEGFDAALLPIDPVKRAQTWKLEGTRLSGLNALIEAMGFKLQRNALTCAVSAITADTVEVSLDWRITAEQAGRPAVLRFTGSFVYDRTERLVTRVALKGGRLADSGVSNAVEINIRRTPVEGWLDFSD
jgi:hypothetical protein